MLTLGFSQWAGKVQVSCDSESVPALQLLRGRFASARSINRLTFDLDIDDLLVNLFELAAWPSSDTDVHWQRELLQLAETNASDVAALQARLAIPSDDAGATQLPALGGGWTAPLTDFQTRDIGKLLELAHGANFSVPGAGKTRATLAVYQARKDLGEVERLLVVCPKSAFESWEYEANYCYQVPRPIIRIMDSPSVPHAEIVLINYERLPDAEAALIAWLRELPGLVVLDEAHRMKRGATGAWGSTCLALSPYAKRRLILTGTPAPNGARDLESLFAFVWPGQGRAYVSQALQGQDLRAASQILRPLFVRTTKSELQLPHVEVTLRRIDLPPLHRKLYDALLGQFSGDYRGAEDEMDRLGRILLYLIMAATTPALLATGASPHEPLAYRLPPIQPPEDSSLAELMRDLPHYELSPKYQEVLALVSENASMNRKTLVWSTFVRNLKSLELLLARFEPAIVHGGTLDRTEQLERFRNDPNCTVLLSNPATLGEGVSLHQVCHDAVYVDRDFAAGRFLQSLDRIHRLGLDPDTVTRVTILIATQTIDELIEQRLAIKLRFLGTVLDDPAVTQLGDLDEEPTISAGMDANDLSALVGYLSASTSS